MHQLAQQRILLRRFSSRRQTASATGHRAMLCPREASNYRLFQASAFERQGAVQHVARRMLVTSTWGSLPTFETAAELLYIYVVQRPLSTTLLYAARFSLHCMP